MALIDTSVLVAYFCPEPLSERASRELQKAVERIITPLIEVELASALAIKTRTGQADQASARAVIREFRKQMDSGLFTLREVAVADYRRAFDWLAAFDTPLRTADAIHLACAANQKQRLVTADQELAHAARKLGIACTLLK